jgi:hypothetical protein
MAIPASGDGQEVLRRGVITTQTSSNWTSFVFTGGSPTTGTNSYTVPANHIITMLSIIWCETNGTAATFHLNTGSGYILYSQDLAANGTFIWTERYVVPAGGLLQTLGGTDIDVWYSYLDQDWS